MKFKLLLGRMSLVVVLGWTSLGATEFSRAPVSAIRKAGETYSQAVDRFSSRLFFEEPALPGRSVFDSQVSTFADLNIMGVAQVESRERLQTLFETYRDLRYLPDPEEQKFMRRLSWMYPDDGCFLRAELLGRLLEIEDNPDISKIFVFGDLLAPTPNHPSGAVQWWYHVAPLYRVEDEAWVLDPSVEPLRPVTIAEWGQRVGDKGVEGQTTLHWSVCHAHSVDPFSDCLQPHVEEESNVKLWLSSYLQAERARAVEMGRVPNEVLGELPPWKTPTAPR